MCTSSNMASLSKSCGMRVAHGDIVHADYQGAVVIPADCVAGLAAAADLVSRREKAILDICRDRDSPSRN